MNHDLPLPELGLTPEEAQTQFNELQRKLVPLWKSIQSFNQDEQTIVVVPSMTIDFEGSSSELQAYEERFLFLLLLLRQPRARLVYVTSQMIQPNIIDYYLDLLPGVISSHARKRLFLVSPLDSSSRPLSLKLLERPRLIDHIRSLILDFDRAHLVPYNTTTLERDLAIRLGIPMYGADAKFFRLGTKSGSRRIFAERIVGEEFRSPSTQLRVTPLGEVERLSTHDQILGGPSGQSYLGCRFPADVSYAPSIMREATKVGARLAREGVVGRFAIDFVVVRDGNGNWDVYAIEINLRKGGTTHPFLTLQFLTDGAYDADKGVFTTTLGQQKCFVASDHQDSPLYRAFTPDDLFDIAARHGIHFDQTRQTGVVFHMMSALGELGRLGLTAVGNTAKEAEALYAKAVGVLEQEARLALNREALPAR